MVALADPRIEAAQHAQQPRAADVGAGIGAKPAPRGARARKTARGCPRHVALVVEELTGERVHVLPPPQDPAVDHDRQVPSTRVGTASPGRGARSWRPPETR